MVDDCLIVFLSIDRLIINKINYFAGQTKNKFFCFFFFIDQKIQKKLKMNPFSFLFLSLFVFGVHASCAAYGESYGYEYRYFFHIQKDRECDHLFYTRGGCNGQTAITSDFVVNQQKSVPR